jgi:RimJ/RimL family protein N-acetyltransferase
MFCLAYAITARLLGTNQRLINSKIFYNLVMNLSKYLLTHAKTEHLPWIMASIDACRLQLATHESGQWQGSEPSLKTITEDIDKNRYYLLHVNGQPVGGTAILTDEPAYNTLLSGAWLNQEAYLVLHRFFISPLFQRQHYGQYLLMSVETLMRKPPFKVHNIRIDTHALNLPMRRLLKRMAYNLCGEVELPNAGQRLVYHKVIGV